MSTRLDAGAFSGRAGATDIEDLLDAAEDLERQLDAEPGVLLRELTAILRRRTAFGHLKRRFGSPIAR